MAVRLSKKTRGIPRIASLRVENYRALRKVELNNLTPMTVLLGPNGSGKP
jgi:AAA15 family ATPase/GTPase